MTDIIATSKLAKYPFLPYFKGENLRICMTGAGGFIASHLAKRLKAEGHYVVACDWKRNSYFAVSLGERERMRGERERDRESQSGGRGRKGMVFASRFLRNLPPPWPVVGGPLKKETWFLVPRGPASRPVPEHVFVLRRDSSQRSYMLDLIDKKKEKRGRRNEPKFDGGTLFEGALKRDELVLGIVRREREESKKMDSGKPRARPRFSFSSPFPLALCAALVSFVVDARFKFRKGAKEGLQVLHRRGGRI